MSKIKDNDVQRNTGGRPRKFDRDVALRQAMDTFWLKGYDGSSIADLTAAMHMNAPSLYATFGGKESLYREAVDLYSSLEGVATKNALEAPGTTREVIGMMLKRGLEAFTAGSVPRGCMVMIGGSNISSDRLDLRLLIRERQQLVLDAIHIRLEKSALEKELIASADVDALTTLCGLILTGLAVQAREGFSPAQLLAAIDAFVKTLPIRNS
jgi:AcrR family transcriptional regulator